MAGTHPTHSGSARRLTTRVTEHVQAKLDHAAALVGTTLNQFVVQAALEKAERVIDDESVVRFSREQSLWLLDLLVNPPPRNAAFLKAQARYKRLRRAADRTAE